MKRDRFFRESFGRREIAQDFLRHQLPEDLLAEIDLETLAIDKDSYVSKELRVAYVTVQPPGILDPLPTGRGDLRRGG